MSERNVELVRQVTEPYEGKDIIPTIRAGVELFGPDPDPEVVLGFWAEDPSWRHMDPDLMWDTSGIGSLGSTAEGAREVALWWSDWTETWKSYVYRSVEHRDLGDWVLNPVDIEARGPGDIEIEMRTFQIWRVRNEKVVACRVFMTESEALEAAKDETSGGGSESSP